MADDAIEDGKVYVLTGTKLKELFSKTKEVRGLAGHIAVGTESDGAVSLKFENTIRVEVFDPDTEESIIVTVPYIKKETPATPLAPTEIETCEGGTEVVREFIIRQPA